MFSIENISVLKAILLLDIIIIHIFRAKKYVKYTMHKNNKLVW